MCGILSYTKSNNTIKILLNLTNKVKLHNRIVHILVDNNKIFGFIVYPLMELIINQISHFLLIILLICNGEIYNFKELYNDLNIVPSMIQTVKLLFICIKI